MNQGLRRAVLAALGACFWCLVSCGPKPPQTTTSDAETTPGTNSQAAAVPLAVSELLGRWQRPDGGYVLELKTVDSSGNLEAYYFNPASIRVSKARAIHEGNEVTVFVELRDVNYPGCTYSLKHDPKFDQLYGEYFQAALGQRFDVTFARMKPD